jgi:broad-specificity NMP kinase
MRLIVVHGPPGIGKDAIARALAARLGCRYLNYHRMMEEVGAVFGWATPPYLHVRDATLTAVRQSIAAVDWPDLVCTMIFEPTVDVEGWNTLFRDVDEALVVDLRASPTEHARRLASETRQLAGKLATVEDIAPQVERGVFDVPPVAAPVLSIDTTELSPNACVEAIVRHVDGMT